MKNTLDFIRELILDLHLTEEEQRSGLILECPEMTMERLCREIKEEALRSGFTMVGLNMIIGEKQDIKLNYPMPFQSVTLETGTFEIKHSNKFALYPKVNKVEYR